MPNLRIKKLHDFAVMPKYQSAGAACFDIHSLHDGTVYSDCSMNFRTGLAFEVPEGFVMMVYSRSGHGFKNGVRLSNNTGVVDSDYRGELFVKLHNDGEMPFKVEMGDRIAQAMLIPVCQWQLVEAMELSETKRGENGLGSTGA